jgi:hypothetical protein
MRNLKELNLTNEEFQLIIDGLDELPNKGAAGEMMGDLMIGLLSKDDDELKTKMDEEREKRRRKVGKDKEILVNKVKILQGKLLQFKNYLEENNLLAYRDIVDIN